MASEGDVVVVGAGLAGLACALRLHEAGVAATVLESSDGVGGRARTDVVDGFRVDRGFQVINPAYPALRRVADLAGLAPRSFGAGLVAVRSGRRFRLADPRRVPGAAAESLLAPVGSVREKAAFAAWALRAATGDARAVRDHPDGDETLAAALDRAGVRGRLRRGVVEPFLAGVLGEEAGQTSAAYARLVVRSLVHGTPMVPSTGVGALAVQLATALPAGSVRLGAPVQGLRTGGRVAALTPQGEVGARAVVVATDASTAATLLPGLAVPPWRALTTFWHLAPSAPAHPAHARFVHVDADRSGPLANTAVVSAVAPGYAPTGDRRHLVASTVVGHHPDADTEALVRRQLAAVYGVDTAGWQLLETSAVPRALPASLPPLRARQAVDLGDGVFVAGDHRDTPSQQGALTSGRRAADAVLAALGLAPAPGSAPGSAHLAVAQAS